MPLPYAPSIVSGVMPRPVQTPGLSYRSGRDVAAGEAFSTEPKMLIAATAGARNCFFMLVSTFRKWNSFPETVKAVFLPNLPIRTDQVDHAQIITATTKNVVFSQHRRCQFQFLRHPA